MGVEVSPAIDVVAVEHIADAGISFNVWQGESFFGLVGPNSAGKGATI